MRASQSPRAGAGGGAASRPPGRLLWGPAPTAAVPMFAAPAASILWNPTSARRSAFPWRPHGKLEQVARRQICRSRVTLSLVSWFSGWTVLSPRGLIVLVLNFYLLPPRFLGSPYGRIPAWHGEMVLVFFALRGRADGPLCGARMRTTWTRI